MGLLSFLKNGDSRRSLKKLDKMANEVERLEPKYKAMTDAELQSQTQVLKDRLKNGETLDDILFDAFAALREASSRVLGMRHFHVQIIGGICLFQGRIAEMKTGEGKTLVATLPAYLEALSGKGVHIVTVNDYLARRDAEWMGKVHRFMGLTVGVVVPGMDDDSKRAAYKCDITYGTNNEFGFDYLRDNLKSDLKLMVQRELNFAIVDEVDSILIDEARTPLIISGKGEQSSALYEQVDAAEDFVLRNIRLGARIEGLYREDYYELPPEAIREAIVNAVVHRDLQANSCVQVALYDDRLEVTSPGPLFGGITIEQALDGATALRNPKVAEAFMQMDMFESWGTGLRRIRDACAAAGLPEPEFREIGNMFRVNIFRLRLEIPEAERPSVAHEDASISHGRPVPVSPGVFSQLSDNEKAAVRIAAEVGRVNTAMLFERAGIPKRSATRLLRGLSERGVLTWHGTSKTDPSQYYDFGGRS